MHPDRIEIMSPGGLPYGLTEVEFLQGQISMLRNPVLGNVFFRLHYIEMFGTGVKRIKEAYQAYSLKPIFEVFENSIKVTLPTITAKPSFTVGEETVYAILLSGKYLSSSEIASGLGLSKVDVLPSLKEGEPYCVQARACESLRRVPASSRRLLPSLHRLTRHALPLLCSWPH